MSKKKYLGKADKSYDSLHKGIKTFDKQFADKEIKPGIRSFDSGFNNANIGSTLKSFDKKSLDSLETLKKNNPFLKKKW